MFLSFLLTLFDETSDQLAKKIIYESLINVNEDVKNVIR